jgi:hypothetical protein
MEENLLQVPHMNNRESLHILYLALSLFASAKEKRVVF